jgi:single-strand DNA-binding protein
VNRVFLTGRIGKDPELRYSAGGQAILAFSLATDERHKDRDGQWQSRPEWHRCVVFGRQAEGLDKILHKGKFLVVEGALRTREWEKDGSKRWSTEIVVREVDLGPRTDGGGQRSESRGGSAGGSIGYADNHGDIVGDDDIPFCRGDASDVRRLTRSRWERAL